MPERDACEDAHAHASHWRDMAPHIDTLTALARGARSVLELGTRNGCSTWALLDGLPEDGVMLSVDTDPTVLDGLPFRIVLDPRWRLVTGNSLTADIGAPDLVFIDTSHEEDPTFAELMRAADHGARVIALHDWFGTGVAAAVVRFLGVWPGWSLTVEPSRWGLAILERRL